MKLIVPKKEYSILDDMKNPIIIKVKDKVQVEAYMILADKYLKKSTQNRTIGIIISKEQDKYVTNFVRSNDIIPLIKKIKNIKGEK